MTSIKTLCFATNNEHKLAEIQGMLGAQFQLRTLKEIGSHEEIPETHDTIAENSLEKATFIAAKYNVDTFADDSGLVIDALNGEPGVHSAHYAGPQRNSTDNLNLVLEKLDGVSNRTARFVTVITLVQNGEIHQFEGSVEGTIIDTPRGEHGFGYDPIFVPNGYDRTFAEMTMEEKAAISHRSRAFQKLITFLHTP